MKWRKMLAFCLAILILFLGINLETKSYAQGPFKYELSRDKISSDQSTVLKLIVPDNLKLDFEKILIDASELGYKEVISLDLGLLEVTLSVRDDVIPGVKKLKVTGLVGKDTTDLGELQVEVVEKDSKDFSWDEAIIYFLLTDRFNNGDPSNDDPHGQKYDKSHLESYHGGDFRGIIDKLDYLKDLGVNTIWISPIVDNIEWNLQHGKGTQYAYHGYWAKDFTKIEEHFGDLDTFKELIDHAHDRGMKIMVDVVLNHTGYGLKISDSGKGIDNFPSDEDRLRFKDMLRLTPKKGDPVLGELAGLPDFKTEEPEVRKQVVEWQRAWLEKARTDKGNTIDYFRVDTVKHLDKTTLKHFKNEIIKTKPDFRMIGEFFDGTVYSNGRMLEPSLMDSVLDFDFKMIAKDYTRGKFEDAEKQLANRNKKLNNTSTTGQFLSSHDEDGFLAVRLNGDQGLFKIASSLQLTAKGQPVIYYGEEIALSGKNAGDFSKGQFGENRYDFDWSKLEGNSMLDHYKKLLTIRNNYRDIFTDGDRKSLASDKKLGLSAFSRGLDDREIVVALNIKDKPTSYKLLTRYEAGTKLKDLYSDKEYEVDDGGLVEIEVASKDQGGTSIVYLEKPAKGAELIEELAEETPQESPEEEVKPDNNKVKYILLGAVLLALASIFFVRNKKK